MMRSRLAAFAALAALGCSHEAAPGSEIKEPSAAPVREAPSAAPPPSVVATAPPAPTPAPAPLPPPFSVTEVAPTQGDLVPVLVTQAQRARDKNLRPVAYFYADWCPPCKLFQASLDDPKIQDALHGVFLIKLNLDDWHDKAKGSPYVVKFIPSFFLVQPDGKPLGKLLDGDKWGKKATVETLAASLTKFLAQGT
jgi:thiol-disulfide isomerase/thioredoxin